MWPVRMEGAGGSPTNALPSARDDTGNAICSCPHGFSSGHNASVIVAQDSVSRALRDNTSEDSTGDECRIHLLELNCGLCSNRILLYFPLFVRVHVDC